MPRFRSVISAIIVMCLLVSFVAVQSASAAVISTAFTQGFGFYYYGIIVNPADTIISVSWELCSGATGFLTPGVSTNGYTIPAQPEPIAWVTSVWVSNGTVTSYSGDCSTSTSSSSSPNTYKQSFSDEAGNAELNSPKNGNISYGAGTCSVTCVIQPNLPKPAKNSLPGDAISTLYVRLAGGEGSYTACFYVGQLTNPVIYRYVSGVWISQAVTVGGGKVCTSASGDGAFALGGS